MQTTTTLPKFTIQEMLECGIHFGHRSSLWNPKMAPFIYATQNKIHVIDLRKTAALLMQAMQAVIAVAKKRNSKILFVGTKRQAGDHIKEYAIKCGQYYVNHRWLGGMLTNWDTVSKSIKKLEELEKTLKAAEEGTELRYNKKELLDMDKKRQKLESALGGIRNMKGVPDLIFVVDTNKEKTAIREALTLKIPVIAVVDTNSEIDGLDYIIPGNDDAEKAIEFYSRMICEAVLTGMEALLVDSGVKIDQAEFEQSEASKTESAEVSTPVEASSADSDKPNNAHANKSAEDVSAESEQSTQSEQTEE
jgi:small subunit ribosomal protein S2